MGLPIAIGGKALSSRSIAPPQPIPNDASDGTILEAVVVTIPPRLATAVSHDSQLSAVCSISYYDMMRTSSNSQDEEGRRERVMAEVRVQVSPLSQAFSSKYRNVLYRIPFPIEDEEEDKGGKKKKKKKKKDDDETLQEEQEDNEDKKNENNEFVPLSPSVVFASDGRNLACLIPHPRKLQSLLVVFQLRKPRANNTTETAAVTLPRPSYLNHASASSSATTSSTTTPLVRVATNPHVTKLPNDTTLLKASAICNVEAQNSGSLLLAACVDGSILVIAYRPAAQVAGILHPAASTTTLSKNDACITSIAHRTDCHDAQDGSRGKLVAIQQQNAILFSSHLVISETSDMMLMQLQKLYSLGKEQRFLKAIWMTSSFLALLTVPSVSSHAACQVWPIEFSSRENEHEQEVAPTEPVATLLMSCERLNEYSHGSFSLESAASDETSTNNSSLQVECLDTATELQYDADSGCLAVSSLVLASQGLAVPFACIWHWRTNVVGLLLSTKSSQHVLLERNGKSVWKIPIYSSLYVCQDFSGDGGNYVAHVISDSARDWKSQHQNRIRKEVYSVALLSPSETSLQHNAAGCEQPSSLMVSSKCVTFPSVSRPFSDQDYEFTWKDARIPASYTATFGTPKLACIGRRRCRSIAVASSKGMCVLDCSRMTAASTSGSSSEFSIHLKSGAAEAILGDDGTKGARIEQPKWRLFGNETDERTFRVLAMTWWEGNTDRKSGVEDVHSDDLLVAVIAVQDETKEKKDELIYLACWSPRRLDQTNQMMVRWRNITKSRTSPTWGIRLPAGFNPSSISLLSDPLCTEADSSDGASWNRRAVLLLRNDDDTKDKADNISYQLYQLEVGSDGTYPETQETKFVVKAKLCSDGDLLDPETSTRAPVSGVFLASASFDFITAAPPKSSRNLNNSETNGSVSPTATSKTFLAAVGIIRSPCRGLEAVLISTDGVSDTKEIISASGSAFLSKAASEVSSYWHSHTIPFDPSRKDKNKRIESFFVWSIELCDGSLISWSVPYINGPRRKSDAVQSVDETEHAANLSIGVTNPMSLMDGNGENKMHQSLFGSTTSIGDSSSWIQETSVANRTAFSLGCIPSTSFGCMLRCAQSGKDLHRFAPVENGDHGSARDLDHEIFCLGSTELAPPSLVPSLYASLVGRVEKVGSDPFDSHVSYTMDFSSNTVNAFTMLNSVHNEDTVLLALRTLIIRIIELIARESDKMGNDISAQHSLFLLTTTFADLVEAAKERLPTMQFVSLFLGIGRQIEPSYLTHLFPLPLSTTMPGSGQHKCRTVDDLFQISVCHGSISVASSALPLFSSKRFSLKMCASLIRHCLETFEENSDSPMSVAFDLSAEERRMLRGIFHFGVRIEDSGTMPLMEPVDELDPLLVSSPTDESVDATDHSLHSSMSMDTSPEGLRGQLLAQRSSARICQMFSSSSLLSSFQRRKEEEAIFDAASSFILSGFDEVKIGFESPSATKSVSSRRTGDGSVSSESGEITMAGIIASFLLPLAFPTEGSKQKFRWKRTATLAQVLVGDSSHHDNNFDASTKIRTMTRLAEKWSLEEIIFSLQISNSSLNNDFSSAEKEKWLVRLLKRHLVECGMMMSTAHASIVLRLVMVLLDRYSFGRDIKARSPGLLLLGVIVAHCAGYQRELLDARPRNKFTSAYVTALNEIRKR